MLGNPFHSKGFTSLTLALTSIVMTVSGIVLYLSPRGRVANWTGWSFMGIDKESWGGLHMVMAVLLLAIAGLHLFLNWRTFLSYLHIPSARGLNLKKEFAAATALTAVVVGGTLFDVPPFSSVPTWGESIKDAWETPTAQVPYAHAELSTIREFAERTGESVEHVTTKLAAKGIQVADPNRRIKDVAAENGVTPRALFTEAGRTGVSSGSGFGVGRKTLRQMIEDEGLTVDTALQRLQAAGIEAKADENVRTVAERSGKNPHELLTLLSPPAP